VNEQPVSTCSYLTLVMLFLLTIATFANSLVVLRCYALVGMIQIDYRLDRESISSRQREIMSRLNSIEICVDAKPRNSEYATPTSEAFR
jgi:hypothetical protein